VLIFWHGLPPGSIKGDVKKKYLTLVWGTPGYLGHPRSYIGTGTLSTISRRTCSACSDFFMVEV
jgi:hypothetical protein